MKLLLFFQGAVLIACAYSGNIEIMKLLLQNPNINVNIQSIFNHIII